MKALTYTPPSSGSGAPTLRIVDQPTPGVGKGEVLVRTHFAGLSHIEYETLKGQRNKYLSRALRKNTVVSGIEMSGVAESDGEGIKQGDTVFGYTNIFKGPFFHAEYVSLPEHKLALLPKNMSLEGAASIIGGALTSIAALERITDMKPDFSVLITGATGSVGVTGVQLATHLGANVSAVCHSTQTDFVISAGASQAYAYDHKEMPEAANQYDLVFDAAPSLSFVSAGKYLKPRALYITTMPHLDIPGFLRSLLSAKKFGYLMEIDTDAKRMERLRTLISDGAFQPVVDSVYPLARAPEAFDRQQKPGKRGKILLDLR